MALGRFYEHGRSIFSGCCNVLWSSSPSFWLWSPWQSIHQAHFLFLLVYRCALAPPSLLFLGSLVIYWATLDLLHQHFVIRGKRCMAARFFDEKEMYGRCYTGWHFVSMEMYNQYPLHSYVSCRSDNLQHESCHPTHSKTLIQLT